MEDVPVLSIQLPSAFTHAQQESYVRAFAQEFGINEPRFVEDDSRLTSHNWQVHGKIGGASEESPAAFASFSKGTGFPVASVAFVPALVASIPRERRNKRSLAEKLEGLIGTVMVDSLHGSEPDATRDLLTGFFEQALGLPPGSIGRACSSSVGEPEQVEDPNEPKTRVAIFWLPRDSKLHSDRELQRKALEAFATESGCSGCTFNYDEETKWWNIQGVSITSGSEAAYAVEHAAFELEFDSYARQKYPQATVICSTTCADVHDWLGDVEKRLRNFLTDYAAAFGPDRISVSVPKPANWTANSLTNLVLGSKAWIESMFHNNLIMSGTGSTRRITRDMAADFLVIRESETNIRFTFFDSFLRSVTEKFTREAALQRRMEAMVAQYVAQAPQQTVKPPAGSSLADLTHRAAEEQARERWINRRPPQYHPNQPKRKLPG